MNYKTYLYYKLIPLLLKYLMGLAWLVVIPLVISQYCLYRVEIRNGVQRLKMKFGYNKKRYTHRFKFIHLFSKKWRKGLNNYLVNSSASGQPSQSSSDFASLKARYHDYNKKYSQSAQDVHRSVFNSLITSYLTKRGLNAQNAGSQSQASVSSNSNRQQSSGQNQSTENSESSQSSVKSTSASSSVSTQKQKNQHSAVQQSSSVSHPAASHQHSSTAQSHVTDQSSKSIHSSTAKSDAGIKENSMGNQPRRDYDHKIAQQGFEYRIYQVMFKHYQGNQNRLKNSSFRIGYHNGNHFIRGIDDALHQKHHTTSNDYYKSGYHAFRRLMKNSGMDRHLISLKTSLLLITGYLTND